MAGVIALLVLVGAIFMTVNRGGNEAAGSTIHPNTGTPTAKGPEQTGPSGNPTSGGGKTTGSSSTVDLSKGCSVSVPSGWTVAQQEKGVAVLVNSDGDMVNAQCAEVEDNDADDLVDRWLDILAEDGSDAKKGEPSTVKTPSSELTAAQQDMTYTETTSQGSVKYGVTAIATSRIKAHPSRARPAAGCWLWPFRLRPRPARPTGSRRRTCAAAT